MVFISICVICMTKEPPLTPLKAEHRQLLEAIVSPVMNTTEFEPYQLLNCPYCNVLLQTLYNFRQTALRGVQTFKCLLSKHYDKRERKNSLFSQIAEAKPDIVTIKIEPGNEPVYKEEFISVADLEVQNPLEEVAVKTEPVTRPDYDSESTINCPEPEEMIFKPFTESDPLSDIENKRQSPQVKKVVIPICVPPQLSQKTQAINMLRSTKQPVKIVPSSAQSVNYLPPAKKIVNIAPSTKRPVKIAPLTKQVFRKLPSTQQIMNVLSSKNIANVVKMAQSTSVKIVPSTKRPVQMSLLAKTANNIPTKLVKIAPTTVKRNIVQASRENIVPARPKTIVSTALPPKFVKIAPTTMSGNIGPASTGNIVQASRENIVQARPKTIVSTRATLPPKLVKIAPTTMTGNIGPASTGNIVLASTGNTVPERTGNIVLASTENIVPERTGNIVLASTGNIVPQRTGHIVPERTGNIVLASTGNIVPKRTGNIVHASTGNIVPEMPDNIVPTTTTGRMVRLTSTGDVISTRAGNIVRTARTGGMVPSTTLTAQETAAINAAKLVQKNSFEVFTQASQKTPDFVTQLEQVRNKPYLDSILRKNGVQVNVIREERRKIPFYPRRKRGRKKPAPAPCPECTNSYSGKQGLKRHFYRIHAESNPVKCKICKREFRSEKVLRYHMFRNQCKKNYECDMCGKRFFAKSNVSAHIGKVHEKKPSPRPHGCHICGKAFTVAKTLREHLLKHQGLRPFTCKLCPATFMYSASLFTHNRQIHLKIKGTWKKKGKEKNNEGQGEKRVKLRRKCVEQKEKCVEHREKDVEQEENGVEQKGKDNEQVEKDIEQVKKDVAHNSMDIDQFFNKE